MWSSEETEHARTFELSDNGFVISWAVKEVSSTLVSKTQPFYNARQPVFDYSKAVTYGAWRSAGNNGGADKKMV